jgi:hypothetical protein
MSQIFLFFKKYHLICIYIIAVLIRIAIVQQGDVFFYFDQARDAAISQKIFTESDIKIQGPSVSGTNDSVYHGVLYYYLLGFIYYIGSGNPNFAAGVLALIGSLSSVVVYFLAKEVFHSKSAGVFAAVLVACSAVATHQHVWLSNPQLNSIFLPMVYLLSWRIFFSRNHNATYIDWLLLGLVTAGAMQAALQSIVLLPNLAIALLYSLYTHKNTMTTTWKYLMLCISVFLAGISSMILTHVLLWRNGILSFSSLNLEEHSATISANILAAVVRYLAIIQDLFAPQSSWLLGLVVVIPIAFALRKVQKHHLLWFCLSAFAPLWLLAWHFRDPIHTFIGLEVLIYLFVGYGSSLLWQNRIWAGKVTVIVCVAVFLCTNFAALSYWHAIGRQYYGIQRGALLDQQVALLKTAYTQAAGQTFTFSSLTSPYAINTTWSYLFNWWGTYNNSSLPEYIGMPQAGYPGAGLLNETNYPATVHFTIIEPDTTLSQQQISDFLFIQDKTIGPVTAEWQFGSLRLQLRNR